MALRRRLLGADEQVVVHCRPHGRVLIAPAIALIGLGAAIGAGAALIPRDYRPLGQVGVAALGLLVAGWWCVLPFLRWLTTTYTLTTFRLITRSGVLHTVGKDLPLSRIHSATYSRRFADRLLGSGTLWIRLAADGGGVVIQSLGDVQSVHAALMELVIADRRSAARAFAGRASADPAHDERGYAVPAYAVPAYAGAPVAGSSGGAVVRPSGLWADPVKTNRR